MKRKFIVRSTNNKPMRNLKIEDPKLTHEDGRLEIGDMEIKYLGDGFFSVFLWHARSSKSHEKFEDGRWKPEDWRWKIGVMEIEDSGDGVFAFIFSYGIQCCKIQKKPREI